MTAHPPVDVSDGSADGMPAPAGVPSRAFAPSLARPDTLDAMLGSIALYLHIPFCSAKCPYCDFNSYAGMLGLSDAYVAALVEEIALAGERALAADGAPRRCRTINFGGGTPSLLTAGQVAAILSAARTAFALDPGAEISLEANPGTTEYGHLDELRALGVNRLSMGAQSFDPGLLRWLGRIHGPDEIEAAFAAGRAAGFDNINLDFMYALPGQSLATWEATLERALALRPDHLSLYSLIVEEHTPLFSWVEQGRVQPADEDLAADMYELAEERLARAGYEHYEISNWARPGHECVHNLTYWQNLPYLGLGAGAHSWYAGHRCVEVRPPRGYIARIRAAAERAGHSMSSSLATPHASPRHARVPLTSTATPTGSLHTVQEAPATARDLPPQALGEDEQIGPALERAETAMLGLRLVRGLNLDLFAARYGTPFDTAFAGHLDDIATAGLLERVTDADGLWLRLTARGRLLGNEVFARLLPTGDEGQGTG